MPAILWEAENTAAVMAWVHRVPYLETMLVTSVETACHRADLLLLFDARGGC